MKKIRGVWCAQSLAELAEVVGVHCDTPKKWRGMPGRTGAYPIPRIIEWLRAEGPWRPAPVVEAEFDPMDATVDSPAMERYRLARAEMAELDLAKRRRELVDRGMMCDMLRRFFDGFRRTAEALRRRCGEEAAEIFEAGRLAAEAGVLDALKEDTDTMAADDTGEPTDP